MGIPYTNTYQVRLGQGCVVRDGMGQHLPSTLVSLSNTWIFCAVSSWQHILFCAKSDWVSSYLSDILKSDTHFAIIYSNYLSMIKTP